MTRDGHLASGLGNGKIKIWNTTNGIIVNTLEAHTKKINALALLSNGDLASGSEDKTIKIWFSSTNSVKFSLDAGDSVNCLKELKNGELASGLNDSSIKIWDINTNLASRLVKNLIGHKDRVNDLELLPNGDLASCSDDGSIKIWDTNSYSLRHDLYGHLTAVNKLKLLSNGHLASGSSGRSAAGEYIQNNLGINGIHIPTIVMPVIDNFFNELNGNSIKIWDVSNKSLLSNITNVADVLSLELLEISANNTTLNFSSTSITSSSEELTTIKSTQNMELTSARLEIHSTSDNLNSRTSTSNAIDITAAETTTVNNPNEDVTVPRTITNYLEPGFNFEQMSSTQALDLLKSSYDLSGCLANCSNKGVFFLCYL